MNPSSERGAARARVYSRLAGSAEREDVMSLAWDSGSPVQDRCLTMSELSSAVLHRVEVTLDRIHRVEADFAAAPAGVRQGYIVEEIRRGRDSLAAGEQAGFMEALYQQAPGLPAVTQAEDVSHELAAIAQALEMPEGARPDLQRLLELLPLLISFSSTLSQLTWSAWRTIATTSSIRRGINLQKYLARCAAGDAEVTTELAGAELERLRQLIAAMVWASSEGGQQFATGHLAGFSPAEIEAAVAAESSGSFWTNKAKEASCWRKYLELAEGLEPEAIESAVRQLIVGHAEQVLKNLTKGERR